MPRDNHALFHTSTTSEKLDLFQSLLDSKELTFGEALALLNTIHADLASPQERHSNVYIRYAQLMQTLKRQMPQIHDQVLDAWQSKRGSVPAKKEAIHGPMDLQSDSGSDTTLIERGGKDVHLEAQPAQHVHEVTQMAGSQDEPAETREEGGEEPGEPEVEEEAKEREAEEESKEEQDEAENPDEAEQEEKEPEDVKEDEPQEESEETEEKEEREDNEAESESGAEIEIEKQEEAEIPEAAETKEGEESASEEGESEVVEESESEAENTSEQVDVEEEAESDRMATEAAEAVHQAEQLEVEQVEPFEEEEPPIEGGE